MPTDSREVRPRNFPPRHSSGASRRFFSASFLLFSLATSAAALDLALPLASLSVDAAPAIVESGLILPAPERTRPIALATYEQTEPDSPTNGSPLEEVTPSEPAVDLNAANNFGLKPMSAMSINIALPKGEGGHPEDFAAARFDRERLIDPAQSVGRDWAMIDYRWEASMLCHGPLLFEQLNAERYGITYGCLQPVISGAHFFATVPTIPYKVWANGHDQCQYALGTYRPGSYARPQCYKLRVSADASLFEASIILGLIFALP